MIAKHLLLAIALLMVACDRRSDETPADPIGKWNLEVDRDAKVGDLTLDEKGEKEYFSDGRFSASTRSRLIDPVTDEVRVDVTGGISGKWWREGEYIYETESDFYITEFMSDSVIFTREILSGEIRSNLGRETCQKFERVSNRRWVVSDVKGGGLTYTLSRAGG